MLGKHHTVHAHVEEGKVNGITAHDVKGNNLKEQEESCHPAMNADGVRHIYVSADGSETDERSGGDGVIYVGFQVIIIVANMPELMRISVCPWGVEYCGFSIGSRMAIGRSNPASDPLSRSR